MIHRAAQSGYSGSADAYARGRPEYPAALQPWLHDTLGLAPGCQAVDLGAGSGKFTKLLAKTGAALVAIEPVEAMRAQFAKALPDVPVLAGSAEAMPLADASADVIVCAQAFHWFATEAALAEMRRVLRPGGRLGLVWNVRDESVDWVAAITEIITPYEGDAPRFYKGDWRRPLAGSAWFAEPVLTSMPHSHVGTAQQVVIDRILSVSFIAALPVAEREKVRTRLEQLIATHPALRGEGRQISFPYRTEAYCCAAK